MIAAVGSSPRAHERDPVNAADPLNLAAQRPPNTSEPTMPATPSGSTSSTSPLAADLVARTHDKDRSSRSVLSSPFLESTGAPLPPSAVSCREAPLATADPADTSSSPPNNNLTSIEGALSTRLQPTAFKSPSASPLGTPVYPEERSGTRSATPVSPRSSNDPASPAAPHRGDTPMTESDHTPASPCSASSIPTSHLSPSQALSFSPTAPPQPLSPGPPVLYGHGALLSAPEPTPNSQLDLWLEGVTGDGTMAEPHPISYLTTEQPALQIGDLRRKRPQPYAAESHKLPRTNRACDFDLFNDTAPRQETRRSRKGKIRAGPHYVPPMPEIQSRPRLVGPIAASRNSPPNIFIAGGPPPSPAAFSFWQSRPPRHFQGSPPSSQTLSHSASAAAPTTHTGNSVRRYPFNAAVLRNSPAASGPTAAPGAHWQGSGCGEGENTFSALDQFQPSVGTNGNHRLGPTTDGTTSLSIEAWVSDVSENGSGVLDEDNSSPWRDVTAFSHDQVSSAPLIRLPAWLRPHHSPSPTIDPPSSPPSIMSPQSPRTRERRSPSMPWSRPPWNWAPPPPSPSPPPQPAPQTPPPVSADPPTSPCTCTICNRAKLRDMAARHGWESA